MSCIFGRERATSRQGDPYRTDDGDAIHIRRHDGAWAWEPSDAVLLVAGTTGCATAAEAACRHVHFFTCTGNAEAYLLASPALGGEIYHQAAAIEVAQIIFGSLLGH